MEHLRHLLQPGPDNWAAAPATSSGDLQQRWQEAEAQGGAGPGIDVSLQLVPRFGSQAAGVVALAQDARAAASKWLSQQHRALEWLQLRGAAGFWVWATAWLGAAGLFSCCEYCSNPCRTMSSYLCS